MPKEFYTEKDIEDLVNKGVRSLDVNDNIFLTVLAYEKARELGLLLHKLGRNDPSVPVRPYLSPEQPPKADQSTTSDYSKRQTRSSGQVDIRNRIRTAVRQQLGDQIDHTLLDRIIERVLHNTGVK